LNLHTIVDDAFLLSNDIAPEPLNFDMIIKIAGKKMRKSFNAITGT